MEINKKIDKDNIKIKNTNKNIDFNKLDYRQKWKLYNIAKWEEVYSIEIRGNSLW